MAVDLNYGIGVEGKNLVLKTLGRVYVKVKDRKYELVFRPEDLQKMVEGYGGSNGSISSSNLMFIDSSLDIDTLEYPGDNALIISKDGHLYFTENNSFNEIHVKFLVNDLTLDNLNITNQITFTGNEAPMIIPSNLLIKNLNSDFLDGHHATDFAIKNQTQTIVGNWHFSETTQFENIIGNNTLKDYSGQNIFIDFKRGTIKCNTLSANQIDTPEQSSVFSNVSGIGKEVWVGVQIGINEKQKLDELENISNLYLIQQALDSEELPSSPSFDSDVSWDLNWWYDVFFEPNSVNVNTGKYILRNFNDPFVWEDQNKKFNGTSYSLNDFQDIIYGLSSPDISMFTGTYYDVKIQDNTKILAFVPNMIVKDNTGNIARVVNRNKNIVTIQCLNETAYLEGDKLIVIGSLCRDGGIQFNGDNPSISILKNVLDESSYSIYFGQLSKIDNTKSGIGMILNGSQATNILNDPTISDIQNYNNQTEININNPFINWNNKSTVFNQDGSGYLSNGKIRWGSGKLRLTGVDIEQSRIDNTTITNSPISNSSFQSGIVTINQNGSGNIGSNITFNSTQVTLNSPLGPAGGDLEGNYPNPTLAQSYKNRISTLETQVSDFQYQLQLANNNISTLETQVSDFQYQLQLANNNISTLQSKNTELEARIEALEARS